MMTPEDRVDALRRFVPWDHQGPLPGDGELETKLIAARHAEAAERMAERAAGDETNPDNLLARIRDLESRVDALEDMQTKWR